MTAALICGLDMPERADRSFAVTQRYRAVSMQLAAHLDGHYVELHILTDQGGSIAIACPRNSIFALQRHIEQIGRQCPEIAGWNRTI